MKTPRTDQLLELINAGMFSDKTALEKAISLCESLETELSNRSSDIVKPITISHEAAEQLRIERLEMLNSLMLEALEGVVRVADRAPQEFDAARAAIQYAKGETK